MDKEPSRAPPVPPEYISPFSWKGIRKSPGVIPSVFCISVGAFFVADYVKESYFKPAPPVETRKKREEDDDNLKPILMELARSLRESSQVRHEVKILEKRLADLDSVKPQQPLPAKGNVNVLELSQVIEANNLASANYYKKQLEEQRKALLREHMLKLDGEILKVKNQYKPVLNKVKELESLYETMNQVSSAEKPSRVLWMTCQGLLSKLKNGPQEPLENDPSYKVLKELASKNNRVAEKVIDSIPVKALQHGVQSEDKLVNRFNKVERVCKRVALVGSNGSLANYLLSYLQSLIVFENIEVSDDEVSGRTPVDPTTWSTFDITARVRYCLQNGNLEQAVRYANQLKGQARVVARDWIRDARAHLETRQAINILSTYAEAISVDANRQSSYVE